jgi:hypothetical protein
MMSPFVSLLQQWEFILFFSVIELLIGFYQIHSCLILGFSTQNLSTCACDENDGLILCLSSFHKVMTTVNVMCSSIDVVENSLQFY